MIDPVLALMTCAASAPAKLTPAQAALEARRDTQRADARAAWDAGRQEEAVVLLRQAQLATWRLFGPWHHEMAGILHQERVTPQALAKALPEGTALADYLFHNRMLSAFVHRRGKEPARIDLASAERVEEAVREWRPLLQRGRPDARFGEALRKLVLDPLEKSLEGCKTLLVSPDGSLGTIPFAALPGKREGTRLIEERAVVMVPVPQLLPEALAAKKPGGKASLLALGGLDFGEGKAPRGGMEGGALPGTSEEAAAVRELFRESIEGGAASSLAKAEATKMAVLAALPKARFAHLATHGFFAPETARSALPENDRRRRGLEVGGWDPLLLSGLALSGANRKPRPGEEDGILTALEVSEMDLPGLDLVTLSACETGLGKVAGGEGLLGLQRAFAVAGARTVVASLWKVDDEATKALMERFYSDLWKKRMGKLEALAEAQRWMLKEGRKPSEWAAFVLSGDWR
ncbi:MAG: CHAT domain-containing protein [Gemmataceae bacterium]|nr:CHAT domain-containing protein [Gemmataceae bacterium]